MDPCSQPEGHEGLLHNEKALSPSPLNPLILHLQGDTLLETAENIKNFAHAGQKRQSGEDYVRHLERVAAGVEGLIKPNRLNSLEIARAVGLLHDTVEDSDRIKPILLLYLFLPFGETTASLIRNAIVHLTRTTKTYKAYTEDLFKGAPSEESLLARAVKLEDRIDNTKLGEEFDPESYRSEYQKMAGASQEELFNYYKKKDVLFILNDQNGDPISLYRDGKLVYDQEIFEQVCGQRFRIKIATNASDNLNYFLPEFEEKLLHEAENHETIIDAEKVRERMWALYVSSLDVLESFGRGGIKDILYYTMKREAMQSKGDPFDRKSQLPMLLQMQVLYIAGLYGFKGPDGNLINKDAWKDPKSWGRLGNRMTFEDVERLFLAQRSAPLTSPIEEQESTSSSHRSNSEVILPALEKYNKDEDLRNWARKTAQKLHGDMLRESSERKIDHIEQVAKRIEELIGDKYRDAAIAAAWLHHSVKDHYPAIKVYGHKTGEGDRTIYLQVLLGLRNARDKKSIAGQVCYILDRISPKTESYKTLTDDIYNWRMDSPPPLKVVAGILKSVDRYYKTAAFISMDENEIILRLRYRWRCIESSCTNEAEKQAALYDFYLRNGLLFITQDRSGQPIHLLDKDFKLIYSDSLLERCVKQWNATRVAAMASDNIDFFIPYLEEKALYTTPKEEDLGHGIFYHKRLVRFVWNFYVSSFDCFESLGRKGIDDINYFLRKREHRDRSETIQKLLGFKPILSMIRRLHFASKATLRDPESGQIVGPDEWRNRYELYEPKKADALIFPQGELN